MTTASRVINDTYRDKVSAATRQRVLQVVAELGYQSSVAARALRNKKTFQYSLVLPNLAFSYMPEVVQGLQDVASDMEYGCLLYLTHGNPIQEERIFTTLHSRRIDGIVWMPSFTISPAMAALVKKCPVVELLHRSGLPGLPATLIDQELGGYLAATHLLSLGHRRITIIVSESRHWNQRLEGCRRAFKEWGGAAPAAVIKLRRATWTSGLDAAQQLLRQDPRSTAVLAASDDVAAAVVHVVGSHGLCVPQDLSVVGFGDMPSGHQAQVPLTTVSHPKREIGERAMYLLRQLMEGGSADDVILRPELVVRSSTSMLTK